MYAVIVSGGKQYKVSEGDVIRVEKLEVEDWYSHCERCEGFRNGSSER